MMRYSVEDLINKCASGRAAQELVESIQDELPDVKTVKMHLMRDINRAGIKVRSSDLTYEDTCIKIAFAEEVTPFHRSRLMAICDTYSSTYPEIEVLLATP